MNKFALIPLLLLLLLPPSFGQEFQQVSALAQASEATLKYRDALRLYEQCLAMDTANVETLTSLARVEAYLGRSSEAERYYRKILAADSTNFHANYQLARLYYQVEKYDDAIRVYQSLLAKDEDNSALLRNLGDCYTRLDRPFMAATHYKRAYQLNRENVSLASGLINSLLRLGSEYAKEALDVCDTALFYHPTNRLLRQNTAMALYTNRKYAKADTLYAQLLAEGDSSYLTLKYGGASRYYAGQYVLAIDPLELAYERDSASVEVCLLLGSSLGKTYDRKRAYLLFDKAEEAMQPHPDFVTLLSVFRAETLQKDGRHKEANRLYYQVWTGNPRRIDLLHNIMRNFPATDPSRYADDESRQRALFLHVLFVKETLRSGKDLKQLRYNRQLLQYFYEDAFFRNLTVLPMLAPDDKKTTLPVADLHTLLQSIQ